MRNQEKGVTESFKRAHKRIGKNSSDVVDGGARYEGKAHEAQRQSILQGELNRVDKGSVGWWGGGG